MSDHCTHEIQLGGLCAVCGADLTIRKPFVSSSASSVSTIESSNNHQPIFCNIIHGNIGLKVSLKEASRIEQESMNRLLQLRKLSLVVDLDQTILHATIDPRVESWKKQNKEIASFSLPDSPFVYSVKLRPNLRSFLMEISKYYELHVYTMGTSPYANALMSIIDPDGHLFADRVLSRDQSGSIHYKFLSRIFPTNDSMVVIIDDRGDVWKYCENLIRVRPYEFFVGTGDINKLDGQSSDFDKAAIGNIPIVDDKGKRIDSGIQCHSTDYIHVDRDDELNRIKSILLRVHNEFYSATTENDKNVKNIISEIKSKVFEGCVFVFSGVFPLHKDPSEHDIWKQSFALGARIENELSVRTTHLIAANALTAKVRIALELTNCKIMKIEWLHKCLAAWEKIDDCSKENLLEIPKNVQNSIEEQHLFQHSIHLSEKDLELMEKEVEEASAEDEEEEEEELLMHRKRKEPDDDSSCEGESNTSSCSSANSYSESDDIFIDELEDDFEHELYDE